MGRHRRKPEEVRKTILDMLGKHPIRGMPIQAIARRLGLSYQMTNKYLKQLRVDGKLKRAPWTGYGIARIAYMLREPIEPTGGPTHAD